MQFRAENDDQYIGDQDEVRSEEEQKVPTEVTENEDDMYRDEEDGILDEGYYIKNGEADEVQSYFVNTVRHQKMPIYIDETDQTPIQLQEKPPQ